MRELKLTIDMLPRGAWGTNLSKTLPQKDWDVLRKAVYNSAGGKCAICGKEGELHAHEIWSFDISAKRQRLENIVALCPACHGVKHIRHSQRIGYGEHAKRHFMEVNGCTNSEFAEHYLEALSLFNERNRVDKWER